MSNYSKVFHQLRGVIIMRRKDKARLDREFMDTVLNEAQEIYVAFASADAPYVIPLNFAYMHGKIYVHCAHNGRKIDCIKANAQVGFCTAVDIAILREDATTKFRSVCGTGQAHLVDDIEEKRLALDAIATRYEANCECPATDKMVARTAIICIDILTLSGKQSPTSTS